MQVPGSHSTQADLNVEESREQQTSEESGSGAGVLRRLILPAMCAIAIAAAIELSIGLAFRPTFWQKTTWLMYDPYKSELFDRVEVFLRLSHLENSDPDIISVGDSSGFFSLQSRIVNRYLGGLNFVSLNTGANQAYLGYQAIAEYMLRRSKSIKYVVLYTFPALLPQDIVIGVADLGPITYDALVGAEAYLTPPSAFLAPYAKFRSLRGTTFPLWRAAHPSHAVSAANEYG